MDTDGRKGRPHATRRGLRTARMRDGGTSRTVLDRVARVMARRDADTARGRRSARRLTGRRS